MGSNRDFQRWDIVVRPRFSPFIIDKIEDALQSLGGCLKDIVRIRIYIRNIDDWEPVSRSYEKRFAHIQPANTLVQAGLIRDDYPMEMEAEAIVGGGLEK